MINLDETELARLAQLSADHEMPEIIGALVAEVRRQRRNYECSEKSLQRHEHMVAELMEKVEAWEWFEECFEVMQWLVPMGPNRADGCTEAVMSTLHAQKRAVHADRE